MISLSSYKNPLLMAQASNPGGTSIGRTCTRSVTVNYSDNKTLFDHSIVVEKDHMKESKRNFGGWGYECCELRVYEGAGWGSCESKISFSFTVHL
jgi:hypothetical protein